MNERFECVVAGRQHQETEPIGAAEPCNHVVVGPDNILRLELIRDDRSCSAASLGPIVEAEDLRDLLA